MNEIRLDTFRQMADYGKDIRKYDSRIKSKDQFFSAKYIDKANEPVAFLSLTQGEGSTYISEVNARVREDLYRAITNDLVKLQFPDKVLKEDVVPFLKTAYNSLLNTDSVKDSLSLETYDRIIGKFDAIKGKLKEGPGKLEKKNVSPVKSGTGQQNVLSKSGTGTASKTMQKVDTGNSKSTKPDNGTSKPKLGGSMSTMKSGNGSTKTTTKPDNGTSKPKLGGSMSTMKSGNGSTKTTMKSGTGTTSKTKPFGSMSTTKSGNGSTKTTMKSGTGTTSKTKSFGSMPTTKPENGKLNSNRLAFLNTLNANVKNTSTTMMKGAMKLVKKTVSSTLNRNTNSSKPNRNRKAD